MTVESRRSVAGSGADVGDRTGALDLLLTDAALGSSRRFFPGASGLRFAGALARRPRWLAGRVAGLAGELGRIVIGTSDVAPSRRDRRFADPAWTQNPLLRRVVQAYVVTGNTAEGLVQDVPLGRRDTERISFVTSNLVEALAPSNNPLLSPVAWKAAIDSGGGSVVAGTRHLVRDIASPPRVPSMVPPDAFEVGVDLGLTPGAVVLRTPVFELIQYRPQTPFVRSTPLLVIPPTINKYYILDIAPGRSMVEYLVRQGHQVFVVSWRNPDARHGRWGADTYCQAILDASATARDIAGTDALHLMGACSGGILASMALAHLAQIGQQHRIAGFTLLVTLLDQAPVGTAGAVVDETTAEAAVAVSRARGYLDGRTLAEAFAWLRPGDLIWNYWVNNYLEGKTPACLRPPVLERRHHADDRAAAPRLRAHRDAQRPDPPRGRRDPGHGHRSGEGHRGLVRGCRHRRSHLPVAVVLPQHAAARRAEPLRALHQRAHRGAGEPAEQSEVQLPDHGGRRR